MSDDNKMNPKVLIGICVVWIALMTAYWNTKDWGVVFSWIADLFVAAVAAIPITFFLSYLFYLLGRSVPFGSALAQVDERFGKIDSEFLTTRRSIERLENSIKSLQDEVEKTASLIEARSPVKAQQELEQAASQVTKSIW